MFISLEYTLQHDDGQHFEESPVAAFVYEENQFIGYDDGRQNAEETPSMSCMETKNGITIVPNTSEVFKEEPDANLDLSIDVTNIKCEFVSNLQTDSIQTLNLSSIAGRLRICYK